jgi:diphthine-ammonia ligase
VAGDVFGEAHRLGLEDVCSKVGLKLLEPLYSRDTTELFKEIFSSGFKALVTGVNLKSLGEEVLGFIISGETLDDFLSKIGSVDPLGENGEFHTLVLECPLYSKPFKVTFSEKRIVENIAFLKVSIV